MAIAGHLSRAMMERYSHIRMDAKRKAVEALRISGQIPNDASGLVKNVSHS
jgi:hypothetical protein